jgi:hypothetical protein
VTTTGGVGAAATRSVLVAAEFPDVPTAFVSDARHAYVLLGVSPLTVVACSLFTGFETLIDTVAPPSEDSQETTREVIGVPPSAPVKLADTVSLAVCETAVGVGASGAIGEKTAAPFGEPVHATAIAPFGPVARAYRSALPLPPRTAVVLTAPSIRYETIAQSPLTTRPATTVKTPVGLTVA